MFGAGPVFLDLHQKFFRPVEAVSEVVIKQMGKRLPNIKVSHLFGATAAAFVTLKDVHTILFGSLSLSKELMSICLSRLFAHDSTIHFVNPTVWDKADSILKHAILKTNAAIDASGFVPQFQHNVKRVFFPFTLGPDWVLSVLNKDTSFLLVAKPKHVRLAPRILDFLKGVMCVLLGPQISPEIRCFAFDSKADDSGFIIYSISNYLLSRDDLELAQWMQDIASARNLCAAHLCGFNIQN
jgi:hypothetical protein